VSSFQNRNSGQPALTLMRRLLPAPHVTAARLSVPRLPAGRLRRERLLAQLAGWHQQRLTCLSAPAGYGKTLMAVQLLADLPQPQPLIAWLTAARDDDDPLRFVAALASALDHARRLDDATGLTTALMQQRAEAALHAVLTLLNQTTEPCVIVIDDLHLLTDATVLDWLARAVAQSAPDVHWLLISRGEPPAALARLRISMENRDLTAADLRVTRDELAALLQQDTAAAPDAEFIAQLDARTQGWFAVVQLARSLVLHAAGDRLKTLRELPARLHGRRQLLVSYLSTEIFAQLPLELHRFLQQCAVLPYLEPELCRAVTGDAAAGSHLQRLLHDQLLLNAVDDAADGLVLHQLMREVLLLELQQHYRVDQIQALYRRAADWFSARGALYQALQLLIAGGLPDAAADLLAGSGRTFLLQARWGELRQLLTLLPPEQIDSDGDLLQLAAWTYSGLGDIMSMLAMVRKLEAVSVDRPSRYADADDELHALRALAGVMQGEHGRLHDELPQLIAGLHPASHHARGWLYLFSAIIDNGAGQADLLELLSRSQQAFQRADSVLDLMFTAGLHALILRNNLAPDAMLRRIRETDLQIERLNRPYLTADTGNYLLTLAAETAFWRDDSAAAAAVLWRLHGSAQASAVTIRLETYLRLRSCALLVPFEPEQVRQLEDDRSRAAQWRQAAPHEASQAVLAQLVLLQIEHDWRCGRVERIWPAFQELGLQLPDDDAPDVIWLLYLSAHVLTGRDLRRLTDVFQRLQLRSTGRFRQYQRLRISILQCLQQLGIGEQRAARELLRELLPLIEQTGYYRLLLDHPELAPLLKANGTRTAVTVLERLRERPLPAPLLNTQQRRMLELLLAGADNARIAAEFAITIGTVKWHLNRLYRLIGVRDRRELSARAAEGTLPAVE
jgi:LuxR family maltose regulon positive regulatory protein